MLRVTRNRHVSVRVCVCSSVSQALSTRTPRYFRKRRFLKHTKRFQIETNSKNTGCVWTVAVFGEKKYPFSKISRTGPQNGLLITTDIYGINIEPFEKHSLICEIVVQNGGVKGWAQGEGRDNWPIRRVRTCETHKDVNRRTEPIHDGQMKHWGRTMGNKKCRGFTTEKSLEHGTAEIRSLRRFCSVRPHGPRM